MESSAPKGSGKIFRYDGAFANRELRVQSCTKCHNSEHFLGRGVLTKQNFTTIKFMVENQFMPPPGFTLTDKDRVEINEFVGM